MEITLSVKKSQSPTALTISARTTANVFALHARSYNATVGPRQLRMVRKGMKKISTLRRQSLRKLSPTLYAGRESLPHSRKDRRAKPHPRRWWSARPSTSGRNSRRKSENVPNPNVLPLILTSPAMARALSIKRREWKVIFGDQ